MAYNVVVVGSSSIYCFTYRGGGFTGFSPGMLPSNYAVVVVDTSSIYCLMCAKRPVHKRSAGGPNFHLPYVSQRALFSDSKS